MRLILFLVMLVSIAFGQNDTTKYFKSNDYGWNWQRGKFRSALILPTDTTYNKLGVVAIGSSLYIGNGTKWSIIGGEGVKYTDTASMLSPYLRNSTALSTYQPIGSYATTSQLATKLNISDTTSKWIGTGWLATLAAKENALTFNSPLSRSTNTISIPAASGTTNGYLSSADWNGFNGKQTALNGTGYVLMNGTTVSYDNSTFVTTTTTQTITGRKTFNAATFINHDSLPINTSKKWAVYVDKVTNLIVRQSLPIFIDSSIPKSFTPTATFSGTTAPITPTASYSWVKNGRMVTLNMSIVWANAGTGITTIAIELPSDLPTPNVPSGYNQSTDKFYSTFGNMGSSMTSRTIASTHIIYTGGVFKLQAISASVALKVFEITITYISSS